MRLKVFLFLWACIGLFFSLHAQDYERSAGLRLGNTSGLTYKDFFNQDEAIELLLSGRRDGLQLTTLYVFHKPLELAFNENFYLYYGIGAHVGYEEYGGFSKVLTSIDPPSFLFERKTFFVMGADAILGVEYRWFTVPVTVGFDVNPRFTLIGMRYTDTKFWDPAVSVNYIF